jgi:hypothetical protein
VRNSPPGPDPPIPQIRPPKAKATAIHATDHTTARRMGGLTSPLRSKNLKSTRKATAMNATSAPQPRRETSTG